VKVIFHVDMDAFYVSVERLRRSELNGVPVVIGGAPESRGVVAAASYEARRFGVHSAQPMARALQLCPEAVRVPPDVPAYLECSRQVDAILERFTPVRQKVSVDESFLDMSGTTRLWGPPPEAAATLKDTIGSELGLPCSVGGGVNRLIAKIASGRAKPAGIVIVEPGDERDFLDPLPLGVIPGAGPVVQERLAAMGITSIADLRELDEDVLVQTFGRHGHELAARARGEGSDVLSGREAPKSVSRETTFAEDVDSPEVLRTVLARLLDRAAAALRAEDLVAGGVAVKLRYADFTTPSKSAMLAVPTDLEIELRPVANRLLNHLRERRPEPVRLLGVRLERLVAEAQLGLFTAGHDRWDRAIDGVDRIRERHGYRSLRWGRELAGGGERAEGDGLGEDRFR